MEQDILIPFGSHAGESASVAQAIYKMAGEVAVKLQSLSSLHQKSLIDWERRQISQEYMYLEQIFISLISIYYQMEPRTWEAKPRYGLTQIAEEYGLVLPDWMKLP